MKENAGVSLTPYSGVKDDKDVIDIHEYARTTKACHTKLQEIWRDLEVSEEAQRQQLDEIAERALTVWNTAVDHAQQHKQTVKSRIDEAAQEICKIAEQLGEHTEIESRASMGSVISPGRSIKRQYDEMFGELQDWKKRRNERVKEHDDIQGQINAIKERLAISISGTKKPVKNSISRANMEFLRLELERMRGEKVRRERKMEATLGKLRKLCIEVGADDTDVAASVHPSLLSYYTSMPGHYYSYASYKLDDVEVDGSKPQVDLGDSTFTGLEAKVEEMQTLKDAREMRIAEMQEVLNNMWTMLDILPTDENRGFFEKLLQAPGRLHSHTLDKCAEEIGRLEACQAKAMRAMIISKEREMHAICEATCLPVPDLSMLVSDLHTDSPGQVADALSKLVKMIAEVTVIVERRDPIIKLIAEVEEAFKEIQWHYQHQQQGVYNNRGRDANRLLQRAIRAEERRKKLPKVLARLNELLDDWERTDPQRRPFVLGTAAYRVDVLDKILAEIAIMDRAKPKKEEAKKKGAPGGAKPPLKRAPAASASAAPPLETREVPPLVLSNQVHGLDSAAAMSATASTFGDSASVTDLPMVTPMQRGGSGNTTNLNPLQDLVNNLANASAQSRHTNGFRPQSASHRYAPPPPLSPLGLDDQPNIGSAAESPASESREGSSEEGQASQAATSASTRAWRTAMSASNATSGVDGLTMASGNAASRMHGVETSAATAANENLPSPAASMASLTSMVSRRSVRSEALSLLSNNNSMAAGGVTMRAKKEKPLTPQSKGSAKKKNSNNAPEHSVMFPGML